MRLIYFSSLLTENFAAAPGITIASSLASWLRVNLLRVKLAAEQLNDERRFMKQDDFVLHASDGDVKNVRKGLAEKRLCSVKGFHKEKVAINV